MSPLLGPDGKPMPLVDSAPLRPGIPPPPPIVVPDDVLVDCLVEWGQPREHANQVRGNPSLRTYATRFYFDTIESAAGNLDARERVERCRGVWADMRARERGENRS